MKKNNRKRTRGDRKKNDDETEAKPPKLKSASIFDYFPKQSNSLNSNEEIHRLKKQKSLRSADRNKDFSDWVVILSLNARLSERGWKVRPHPLIGYSKCEGIKEGVGVFELAVNSEADQNKKKVVYIKDGKIKTLLMRYCQHGYQKSREINDALEKNYVISARWRYLSNEEQASSCRADLLEKYIYEWNFQKPKREENNDNSLQGNWGNWIKILSSSCEDGLIARSGLAFGYRLADLEQHFNDKFGVLECKACINTDTSTSENEYFLQFGKILSLVKGLCKGTKTVRINEALRQGRDIFVRSKHVDPNTEAEAQKVMLDHLNDFQYQWNGQRRYREKSDNTAYSWGNWVKVMANEPDNGWQDRGGGNVGYWLVNLEHTFEDRFGVFELMLDKDKQTLVKYVGQGRILPTVQEYCENGSGKCIQINKALEDGYSILIRSLYSSKEQSQEIMSNLLEEYDYEWNTSLREKTETLDGDWSDWITVMQSESGEGWQRRIETGKGYTRKNVAALFDNQRGIFEIRLEKKSPSLKNGNRTEDDERIREQNVVFIGSGSIRWDIEGCCQNTITKYISKYIDWTLERGDTISVRYLYEEHDNYANAQQIESQLLLRYDYPWIRKRREDNEDELPGTWSEWTKILKPGQVDTGWTWRNQNYIGFMSNNLETFFPNEDGVFELAIEIDERNTVVHVGRGKLLDTLKEYCNISRSDAYKGVHVSESLAKGFSIHARYNLSIDSEADAVDLQRKLLERYDYKWNRTKREEVVDGQMSGKGWSDWTKIIIHDRAVSCENQNHWKRRHKEQTGFRLKDEHLRTLMDDSRSGVYELSVERDGRNTVVYVGMSENLLSRMSQYLERGSHKDNDIREALSREYNIYLRFRYTENELEAEQAENELLYRYDYGWNDIRNDRKRDVLTSIRMI